MKIESVTTWGSFIPLHKLAFSPDGQILAAASDNHSTYTLQLWNVQDGTLLQSFEELDCYIAAIAFSPDGQFLATTGSKGECSTSTWTLAGTLVDAHGPMVSGGSTDSLAFSPDGKILAEGSDTCRLWRILANGGMQRIGELYIDGYPIIDSLAFSPDGTMLAGGTTGGLYFWQINGGALLRRIDAYNSRFGGIAWSPDGKLLATGTSESGIEIWDVGRGERIFQFDP